MKTLKWTTVSLYVEQETGQLLTKNQALNNYRIIKKDKRYEHYTNGRLVEITNVCTKNGTNRKLF